MSRECIDYQQHLTISRYANRKFVNDTMINENLHKPGSAKLTFPRISSNIGVSGNYAMQSGNFLRNFFALNLPRSLLACLAQRERFKVTSHDTESSTTLQISSDFF